MSWRKPVLSLLTKLFGILALCAIPAFPQASDHPAARREQRQQWLTRLREEMPLLGHRNWIAVVDSAYPLQTSAGLETVETYSDQLDVVREVLDQIGRTGHILENAPAQSLPHEEIIAKLGEAGNTFHVLVLKTRMTIPYTSVFIRLDCGYWTDEQEKRLREKMAGK